FSDRLGPCPRRLPSCAARRPDRRMVAAYGATNYGKRDDLPSGRPTAAVVRVVVRALRRVSHCSLLVSSASQTIASQGHPRIAGERQGREPATAERYAAKERQAETGAGA